MLSIAFPMPPLWILLFVVVVFLLLSLCTTYGFCYFLDAFHCFLMHLPWILLFFVAFLMPPIDFVAFGCLSLLPPGPPLWIWLLFDCLFIAFLKAPIMDFVVFCSFLLLSLCSTNGFCYFVNAFHCFSYALPMDLVAF